MSEDFEEKGELTNWLMNREGVCRTAPGTTVLLTIPVSSASELFSLLYFIVLLS